MESFSNSPEPIKEVINKYGNNLEKVEEYPERSGYKDYEHCIIMDKRKDNYEYGIVFRHEYGHYIDHVLGNYSEDFKYRKALEIDSKHFDNSKDEGTFNRDNMLHDLLENNLAFESRYVSDILSAITNNDTSVIEFYDENNVNFYWHRWENYDFIEKMVQHETFANLFAIYTENNSEVIKFTEKWFPNIAQEFRNSMNVKNAYDLKNKELIKI